MELVKKNASGPAVRRLIERLEHLGYFLPDKVGDVRNRKGTLAVRVGFAHRAKRFFSMF
jgi:hypothetical protein